MNSTFSNQLIAFN